MTSDRNRLNPSMEQPAGDEPRPQVDEHPFAEFGRWLEIQLAALEMRFAHNITARSVARAAHKSPHQRRFSAP